MAKAIASKSIAIALGLLLGGVTPSVSRAEDAVEKAGVAAGLTVGNVLFLPMKAVSVSMGLISGAASLLFTGNAGLSNQIWFDSARGPYVITPELARQAVGERPELEQEMSGMDLPRW
jgi:hypothetical protein